MTTKRTSFIRVVKCLPVLSVGFALVAASIASAQDQRISSQPIRFIVMFAAGGGSDVVARYVADRMSTLQGQTVVVENRPGAAGVIAARQVLSSDPNGLTVLVASNPLLINQIIRPETKFEMLKELTPVASVAPQSVVLVTPPEFPANSLKELIDVAKKRDLNYGTTGAGSLSHLAVAYLLSSQPDVKMQHIPYAGSAPALTAVMANQVELGSSTVPPTIGLIAGGKLKPIAIASANRSVMLPNVPTYAEAGFPALPVSVWTGFFVPKAAPKDVVDRLSKAILTASSGPEAQAKFKELGFEPSTSGAEKFNDELNAEFKIWADVVKNLDPATFK
ncbi:MAG: hypothetical protein JOZ70_00065 [Pseudolabrys sp.]|nr:hypothetical protein [Pseudolabrys sp.]